MGNQNNGWRQPLFFPHMKEQFLHVLINEQKQHLLSHKQNKAKQNKTKQKSSKQQQQKTFHHGSGWDFQER